MKKVVLIVFLMFMAFMLFACGSGGGDNTPSNTITAANAGPAQNIVSGSLVTLDGSQSTGADGNLITYQWSMVSKPAGSVASINNPTIVNPTFKADFPGQYSLKLIITDEGAATSSATVIITAAVSDAAPVANAGIAQNVATATLVTLDGTASSDANGDLLTYSWVFIAIPNGSSAALSSSIDVKPTFTPDIAGEYTLILVVNDGDVNSVAAMVTITASVANSAPVANAGVTQSVVTGTIVTLDGSASSDANGDLLTYRWTITSKPLGSTAMLSNTTEVQPSFNPDVTGAYVFSLVVNDGKANSAASTVAVEAKLPTSISGILQSNTTLTKADSPYVLNNGNLQVPDGVTLIIEPGVTISGGQISVWGTFNAIGDVNNKIYFNNVNILAGYNGVDSIINIKYANILYTDGHSMGTLYASLISISDSVIKCDSWSNSIYVEGIKHVCNLERNTFIDTSIVIGANEYPINIKNNNFISGSRIIFTSNKSQVYSQYNSFLSNTENSIDAGNSIETVLSAQNNYWGTTDASVIGFMIFDHLKNYGAATIVDFQPILTSPDPATPDPSLYL